MNCPACAHESKVVRTLKLENPPRVIRSRVCLYCGYYFSTQESPDSDPTLIPKLTKPTKANT